MDFSHPVCGRFTAGRQPGRYSSFMTRTTVIHAAAISLTALAVATNGRMAPSPGGIIIRNADNHVIGAVGISGDVGDKDEACGLAGIAALDLMGSRAQAAPGAVSPARPTASCRRGRARAPRAPCRRSRDRSSHAARWARSRPPAGRRYGTTYSGVIRGRIERAVSRRFASRRLVPASVLDHHELTMEIRIYRERPELARHVKPMAQALWSFLKSDKESA